MSLENQKGKNRYNGSNLTKHIALLTPRQKKLQSQSIQKLREHLLNIAHHPKTLDSKINSYDRNYKLPNTIDLKSERQSLSKEKNMNKLNRSINMQQLRLPSIHSQDFKLKYNKNLLNKEALQGKMEQLSIFQQIQNHLKPMKKKTSRKNRELIYSVRTKAGLNGQNIKINQDIQIIDQKLPHGLKLFCVCDGHGVNGHVVAAFIKKKLIENLKKDLKTIQAEYIQQQIYLVLQKTNLQLLGSDINTQLSGSTLIAIFLYEDRIFSFNVGDSRAILLNFEDPFWKFSLLSHDQKPERQVQAKRILAHGGRIAYQTNQRGQEVGPLRVWMKAIKSPGLAMTRSFGDKAGMKAGTIGDPEVLQFNMKSKNKYMLIASDGIWQLLQNYEIVKLLSPLLSQQKLEDAANLLMQKCCKLWSEKYTSRDDITFILVKINSLVSLQRSY